MIARPRAQRPHLSPRRVDLLQDLHAAAVRAARAGSTARACKDGASVDVDEYSKDDPRDFVLWKASKPGRAVMGLRHRPRPSRLAHRVLGDGAAAAGRAADRYPCGRRRSDLSAPRERDRAERRRHQRAVRALLGARRAPVRREREDVEVARQRLHACRDRGARPPAVGAALPAAVVALPQAAQLHLDRHGPGGGGDSPDRRFPRPARDGGRRAAGAIRMCRRTGGQGARGVPGRRSSTISIPRPRWRRSSIWSGM